MPELPEVETIRKTLSHLVLDKQIEDVSIYWSNIIQYPEDDEEFRIKVRDERITNIARRGKFLLFYLEEYVLVSHLRMEGKYKIVSKDEPLTKHTHVVFHFTDGTDMRYEDVRKFGTMHVFPIGEEFKKKPLNQLGPDPFETTYTPEYVKERLSKTSRTIKATLLDQTIIAGLGNIYVDEVLFLANIHPERRSHTLTEQEIETIYIKAKEVLQHAIDLGGTTIRSYVDGKGEMGMFQQELYAYGQDGKPCDHCGTLIEKIKVAGRGTHYCPECQSL
ncbi:MAG TPA: DNA-formamidopyrimidine glycosylase [Pseudogracilibacillus sp.]|nr:DNA-formamidopyrimidine glycosylase [Pseudogracilibacillus sp.]